MIKTNLLLKNNYPFLLKPVGKDYLWGGNKLKKDFNKKLDVTPLAESWECSTHSDGLSYIATGIFKNQLLIDVLKKYPEFLGTHVKTDGQLPILIKLIDARQDLSVQVHPDDKYAQKYENGQFGKTEMWYVLEANEGSQLIHGFNCDVNKNIIKQALKNNNIEKYLNKVPIKKDNLFFIEPGTVHAIGAGTVIAEIQENSNLTYRLYDYNRIDKNGNTRQLHTKKALEVLNYKSSIQIRQPIRVHKYKKGYSSELLCNCKYFRVCKEIINNKNMKSEFHFQTQSNSFHVLLCIEGDGVLIYENEKLEFFKGDCIFVPANSCNIKIIGKLEMLNINC